MRVLGSLEQTGRMARVLVRVADPLGLELGGNALPLLLRSFVRVRIDAGELNWFIAGDLASIEDDLKALDLGEFEVWDVDGNRVR